MLHLSVLHKTTFKIFDIYSFIVRSLKIQAVFFQLRWSSENISSLFMHASYAKELFS